MISTIEKIFCELVNFSAVRFAKYGAGASTWPSLTKRADVSFSRRSMCTLKIGLGYVQFLIASLIAFFVVPFVVVCSTAAFASASSPQKTGISQAKNSSTDVSVLNHPDKAAGRASSKNIKALIDSAQEALLESGRPEAVSVLLLAMKSESRGSSGFRELSKSLDKIGAIYITEKGQLIASAGDALMVLKPLEAIEKYTEALKIEVDHMGLLHSLVHASLAVHDCERADGFLLQAEKSYQTNSMSKLLRLQTLVCQEAYDVLALRLASKDWEIENLDLPLKHLQAADAAARKDVRRLGQIISGWGSIGEKDPEYHRAKWTQSLLQNRPMLSHAKKYQSLCADVGLGKTRVSLKDPLICYGRESVEKEVKKAIADGVAPDQGSE
jgi:hypothetical protein